MRFLCAAFISAALLVVFSGPIAAQKNGEAEKTKRIAEIEKEIADLQARIAKLTAELAKLQPPAKDSPPDYSDLPEIVGTITSLMGSKESPTGFHLGNEVCVYLSRETQFTFSDKQKASLSDLKVGRSVSVRVRLITATKSEPAILVYHGYVVVIDKAKAERLEVGVVWRQGKAVLR